MKELIKYKKCLDKSRFYISSTFISKVWLKLAKNQANAKQHPEAELLLFENDSHSYPRYHLKIIKIKQKSKFVCIHEIMRLIVMTMKIKIKDRSHRYDIIRPRSRHGHNCSKYKKCFDMMMLIYIKQQLISNI